MLEEIYYQYLWIMGKDVFGVIIVMYVEIDYCYLFQFVYVDGMLCCYCYVVEQVEVYGFGGCGVMVWWMYCVEGIVQFVGQYCIGCGYCCVGCVQGGFLAVFVEQGVVIDGVI